VKSRKPYGCQCPKCQAKEWCIEQEIHRQMNLLLSRLDENQRRWYVALEAKKLGHGGIKQMSEITGMHGNTIRRGWHELDDELKQQPIDRIRHEGGGRFSTEKKTRSPE
jgi:hypothetical protein